MSSQARSSHKKAAAGSSNIAAPKPAAAPSSLSVPGMSPSRASSASPSPAPPREAFLPDAELAHHWLFRLLMLIANWWARPLNGIEVKGLKRYVATASVSSSPRGILFFGRHSTHNAEILTLCVRFWQESGRVSRALFHRLLMKGFPWLKYIGGVPGHRESAVALLSQGFWCGVIPGGADEAMIGHENAYQVRWPSKRQGFAAVAMQSNAALVPFFTRNVEESRWNPLHALWHVLQGYRLFEWTQRPHPSIPGWPAISSALYTVSIVTWFMSSFVVIPIPVRCTLVFGPEVTYKKEEEVEAVVERCNQALQALIDAEQPASRQGRNYMRAMSERWEEWRGAYPIAISRVESLTPVFVKRYLQLWAHGGKKKH